MGRQSCEAGVRFLVAGPCVPCWSRGSRGPRNTGCLFKRHARSQRTPGGAAAPRPCERLTVHPDPPPHLGAGAGPGGQRWPLLPALSSPGLRGEMEVFEELRVHSGGPRLPSKHAVPPRMGTHPAHPGSLPRLPAGREPRTGAAAPGCPLGRGQGQTASVCKTLLSGNHSQGEKRILTS